MVKKLVDRYMGRYYQTISKCFQEAAIRRHVHRLLIDNLKISLGIVPYNVDLFDINQPIRLRLNSKGAGDIINLVPLIHTILQEFPKCIVITNHWQIPFQYISHTCSVVSDEYELFNISSNYYDFTTLVNYHIYCPHWIQYFLLLKRMPKPLFQDPFPLLPESDIVRVELHNKPYVVFHTRSERTEWQGRQTHPDNMRKIFSYLHKQGISTVEVGNNIHLINPASISLLDKLSFEDLFFLIKHCSGFVGIDSLPMHVASLYRKPIMGFFGATQPLQVLSSLIPVLQLGHDKLPCLGCVYERRPTDCNVCSFGKPPCEEILLESTKINEATERFCKWMFDKESFENLATECACFYLDYVLSAGRRDLQEDLNRRVFLPLIRSGFSNRLTNSRAI